MYSFGMTLSEDLTFKDVQDFLVIKHNSNLNIELSGGIMVAFVNVRTYMLCVNVKLGASSSLNVVKYMQIIFQIKHHLLFL